MTPEKKSATEQYALNVNVIVFVVVYKGKNGPINVPRGKVKLEAARVSKFSVFKKIRF